MFAQPQGRRKIAPGKRSSARGQKGLAFPVGPRPSFLPVADFDGDGNSDLALGYDTPFYGKVSVLLGKGDGGFRSLLDYPAAGYPLSVVTTDLNGDGKVDLIAADAGGDVGSDVFVLKANGDGTLRSGGRFTVGKAPAWVVVGDFDANGVPDLASITLDSLVSVLMNAGGGSLRRPFRFGVGNDPLTAAVADFNGDRQPDIAVANAEGISMLINNTK